MLNKVLGGIILIIEMIVNSSDSSLEKAIIKINTKDQNAQRNEPKKMTIKFRFTSSPIRFMFWLKFFEQKQTFRLEFINFFELNNIRDFALKLRNEIKSRINNLEHSLLVQDGQLGGKYLIPSVFLNEVSHKKTKILRENQSHAFVCDITFLIRICW